MTVTGKTVLKYFYEPTRVEFLFTDGTQLIITADYEGVLDTEYKSGDKVVKELKESLKEIDKSMAELSKSKSEKEELLKLITGR